MSLMLINPRKRGTKKRRTAAQRAATARLVAHNRGRSASPKRRRRASSKRRTNPIGISRVHHVTRRHHRRARRRNPISMSGGNIGGMLMAGLKGAVGAVAVNAVTNFLPAAVKTGKVLYVTRAAIAIVIGTVGHKVAGRHARAMAEGALAVNFTDLINSMAGAMIPGSQLHGVGGEYMGEFLSGAHMAQSLPNSGQAMHGMGEFLSEYDQHLV